MNILPLFTHSAPCLHKQTIKEIRICCGKLHQNLYKLTVMIFLVSFGLQINRYDLFGVNHSESFQKFIGRKFIKVSSLTSLFKQCSWQCQCCWLHFDIFFHSQFVFFRFQYWVIFRFFILLLILLVAVFMIT